MKSWFPTFSAFARRRLPLPDWWPVTTSAQQRNSLLRLVAAAVEEQIPLAPLLRAFADDERGLQRGRILRLVKLLESGKPLADSIEQVPGAVSERAALAIRFDVQSGLRTAAVRTLLEADENAPPQGAARWQRALAYCATVIPLGLAIVAFIHFKITPRFEAVLAYFDVERPASLTSIAALTSFGFRYGWLVVLALLAALYVAFSTRGGRGLRRRLGSSWLPAWRIAETAEVLRLLAAAMRAGRPLPGCVSTLARYHYDPAIRQRLLFVRNEVEQGADLWESLRSINFLQEADVRLLRTAEALDNRAWALTQIARAKEARRQQRFGDTAEFVLPAILLVLGALVLWQALAILQPLEHLIGNLA